MYKRQSQERWNEKQKHRAGPTSSSALATATAAAAAAAVEAEAAEDAESTSEHLCIQLSCSTRFFGLIFEDEKTPPSSSDLRHRDYPTHAQQSYSYQVPQPRHLPQTLPVPPSVERA